MVKHQYSWQLIKLLTKNRLIITTQNSFQFLFCGLVIVADPGICCIIIYSTDIFANPKLQNDFSFDAIIIWRKAKTVIWQALY